MPSETASKRFKTLYFDSYSHTLPSSSTSGFSGYAKYMYNGYHANSTLSSTGSYYSWEAATNNDSRISANGVATEDVCPKSWKLPLKTQFSGITKYASTFNLVYAGYYIRSSFTSNGTYGYWWSKNIHESNTGDGYYLRAYANGLTSASTYGWGYIYYGFSLRCLAK